MKMKRAYKFLPEKWAIRAIKDQRIKISEIDGLNDVAEMSPYRLSNPAEIKAIHNARDELFHKNGRGILCFSLNWTSLLLWAHYADNHKGICLGFDLQDGPDWYVYPVSYVKERPPFPSELKEQVAWEWISTKFHDWRYESEVRGFVSLDQKEGDHYFLNFGERMTLREVVLGFRCCANLEFVRALLTDYTEEIKVIKARPSDESFDMIADESRP